MKQDRRKDALRTLPRYPGRDAEDNRAADNEKGLADLDLASGDTQEK